VDRPRPRLAARCSGPRPRRPGEYDRDARHVTVVVGNRAEVEVAVGTATRTRRAPRLLDAGRAGLVKMGGEGVLVATPTERTVVPPHPVEVVCGLGAGDAFGGALVHGLLSGWDPARCAEYANAAGALVASRLACADAMPTRPSSTPSLAEERRAARS
jgi:5-dehydro-2-deoxygluconokinase